MPEAPKGRRGLGLLTNMGQTDIPLQKDGKRKGLKGIRDTAFMVRT